ncbi:MAG: glucoronyl hydrolase, partial [Clostridiaceae bacterium]|nr:glucoronyl hydrolase [Clostridiaceae bacterium]
MSIRLFENIEQISSEDVTLALQTAVAQARRNLPVFTYRCQNHSSANNFYPDCDNNQWTCGFWPGQIWLAYEYTYDTVFRDSGDILVKDFLNRIISKIEVDHHDMGFLYTPSCVSAYMLTGNEEARTAALLAADQLMSRFQQTGEFLQAWGAMNADENYRYIIDCLLNLPLLYWAERETGDEKYADIAMRHTRTCLKYSIRSDGSTFHTVFMNKTTGEFERGETCQGYSHDSSWARGQAWAIYGTALSYANSGMKHHYEAFANVLAFYLSRLPADMVPCWDLIFSDGDGEPRDSSSA